MNSTTNTYDLSNLKISADLNQDSTNFDIEFSVKALNKEDEFSITVVNQTDLDNNENIEYYKSVDGELEGTLNEHNNNFQNHYLIMMADKPCTVEVHINKTELSFIPGVVQPDEQLGEQMPTDTAKHGYNEISNDDIHEKFHSNNKFFNFFKMSDNVKNIVIVAVIGIVMYFMLSKLEGSVIDTVKNTADTISKTIAKSPLRQTFLDSVNVI